MGWTWRTGAVSTDVGGGGTIASELELGGHRHKHGERRGSTEYSPRSFMVIQRKRVHRSARRGGSIILDAGLGNGPGTTAKQQKVSAAAAVGVVKLGKITSLGARPG